MAAGGTMTAGGGTDSAAAPRVVVVGAGVAGLATAALLARGGADVTVLERHDQVGGRAGRWAVDGFTFDTGPSWYFMAEVFEHFFALLGRDVADHLTLRRLDPAYRVFEEPAGDDASARVLDVVADAEANWQAFDAIEPGAGKAMREYAAASSESYRIALDHFLYTTFRRVDRLASPEVLRRLPRLARLLTGSLADVVAGTVRSPLLRQVLGYHAVFLGSSPYRAPALYSLMSHLDLVEGVRYPDGGLYALVEALAEAATAEGARIRLGADVVEILVEEAGNGAGPVPNVRPRRLAGRRGRARGVRLAGGEVVDADVVVSAADLHHTETVLLEPAWQTYPEPYWRGRDPGISALLVYAGVRGELPELAHHSLFFTRDWPANFTAVLGPGRSRGVPPEGLSVPVPASLYLSKPSATDPSVAPSGYENLMLLVPFPADPGIGADDGELDRLADRYLDQVARWAGIPDLLDRVVVRRAFGPADFRERFSSWRGSALGMEHTLAQSAMFRPAGASRKVANLLYAGGGTAPGVGLPMCVISAELVAKRLLGDTGTRPLPAPLRPGYLAARSPGDGRAAA